MNNLEDRNPILVIGGTGHYGQFIVRSLVNLDQSVRVISRNAIKAKETLGSDVEIFEGDITDPKLIKASISGVKAIVISISAFTRKLIKKTRLIERDAVIAILEEARKNQINRIVYISVYDLRMDHLKKLKALPLGEIRLEIENILKESNFNWTVLGCCPSMEMFFAMLRGTKLYVPGGGFNPFPTVSPVDLGEIAAQTTIRSDLGGRRFRITGPEALSYPQVAERLSVALDHTIKHIKVPITPLKVLSIITRPISPFIRYLLMGVKLFNNFPQDLVDEVPNDHKILLDTFEYTPHTLEMEIKRRNYQVKN